MCGTEVSKSTITESVIAGMTKWQNRPLDVVHLVAFIDCVHVKVRDGQVANWLAYIALAMRIFPTRFTVPSLPPELR
ncbi:transposase [Streptomyces sp. NPDC052071]|uniref:transposase n=1 Tax=Streptomyces TaxID=1883 RepID=UPI002E1609F9|nr:transposase [[Kitasatospora] papulosa]WSI16799.1 transposase [[Kitasatospora] papulosa]